MLLLPLRLHSLKLFREARRAFGRPKDCDGGAVQSRKSSRPMLTALATDHRPPVSMARRSNGVRSFLPLGTTEGFGAAAGSQIVFGRRTVHVLAKSKSDKTRHHQPGPGYHHPMRIHRRTRHFPFAFSCRARSRTDFKDRLRLAAIKTHDLPISIRASNRRSSSGVQFVLYSHQERNSRVFVFGPGRERANLILSMRARLRIDE